MAFFTPQKHVYTARGKKGTCAGILFSSVLGLAGCGSSPQKEVEHTQTTHPSIALPAVSTSGAPQIYAQNVKPEFASMAGWQQDDMQGVFEALQQNCNALSKKSSWQKLCISAQSLAAQGAPSAQVLRQFFENNFAPQLLRNADGSENGVITGYYEPLLRGSRSRSARFHTALYRLPSSGVRTVSVPRAELQKNRALNGLEIVYVDDAVDAFFLQIQGSGRVQLENGEIIRVAFAGHNNQPYQSIGKTLIDWGEMKASDASMQSIKAWVALNPRRTDSLFNTNPRFVFFKEVNDVPASLGPRGALGVPLTPERSIAVDPAFIALGTPVFLSSIHPATGAPWQRLVLAQDTGSAIKGAVRADYFFGYGDAAGAVAGKTKQQGRMWVLLPK